MDTELLRKKQIEEMEQLYESKKEEYQKTKDIETRLEATNEINIKEFKKLYDDLDYGIKHKYNLNTDKPLEEMTLDEIKKLNNDIDSAFNDIVSKLNNYLRTGNTEELGSLIPTEPKSEPVTVQVEKPEVNQLAEVANVLDSSLEDTTKGLDFNAILRQQ